MTKTLVTPRVPATTAAPIALTTTAKSPVLTTATPAPPKSPAALDGSQSRRKLTMHWSMVDGRLTARGR